MKELVVDAKKEELEHVLTFVDEYLESMEMSAKVMIKVDIAVEELFVNIASYAYEDEGGNVTIMVDNRENGSVSITFIDNGKPYNPLEKEDPDITLPAEERQIGGLGILMVKKSMDDVQYEYKDGKNILTITKGM